MMLWSAFNDIVLAELPQAPSPLVVQYARRVAIDFCETTQLYVVDLTAIDVVATTATYSLTAPSSETTPSEVVSAYLSGAPLKMIPVTQLRRTGTRWAADTAVAPTGFTQLDSATVTLYPKPTANATGALSLTATLKPSLTSTGLVAWMANKYYYDLANGIKALLMSMPGKSWSNPEGAKVYAGMYGGAVTAAAQAAGRNVQRARLTD